MKFFLAPLILLVALAYFVEFRAGQNGIAVTVEEGAQKYSSLHIKSIYNLTAECVLGFIPEPKLTLTFKPELMDVDGIMASGLIVIHEFTGSIDISVYYPLSQPFYSRAERSIRHEFIHLFIYQRDNGNMTYENGNHTDTAFNECLY